MLQWFPRLTLPDLCVVVLTVGLCLAASRVPDVGDAIGRFFGVGKKK